MSNTLLATWEALHARQEQLQVELKGIEDQLNQHRREAVAALEAQAVQAYLASFADCEVFVDRHNRSWRLIRVEPAFVYLGRLVIGHTYRRGNQVVEWPRCWQELDCWEQRIGEERQWREVILELNVKSGLSGRNRTGLPYFEEATLTIFRERAKAVGKKRVQPA